VLFNFFKKTGGVYLNPNYQAPEISDNIFQTNIGSHFYYPNFELPDLKNQITQTFRPSSEEDFGPDLLKAKAAKSKFYLF
jgi:hypothetical protein